MTEEVRLDHEQEKVEDDYIRLHKLKATLMSEPILKLPDFNKPFVLFTDASAIAVSYILCQNDSKTNKLHVIQYGGRKIQKELKYSSSELELFAIIFALRDCKHYLWNVPVKIVTDNKALTYLHTMKHTNGRLYRWAIELENFDYEIVYNKGINNPADYLSRINHDKILKSDINTEVALCDIKFLFNEDNKLHEDIKIAMLTRAQKKRISEEQNKPIDITDLNRGMNKSNSNEKDNKNVADDTHIVNDTDHSIKNPIDDI